MKRRGKDRGPDFFEEELQVDWFHVLGLPVWIAGVGLLVYQITWSRKSQWKAAADVV